MYCSTFGATTCVVVDRPLFVDGIIRYLPPIGGAPRMSQEDGQAPGLFSHDAVLAETSPVPETDKADFRPVFSRSDGSGPGAYVPSDDLK
jgi:hypothetical protein